MSTSHPVRVATEDAPRAIATGLRTPIASGPSFRRETGSAIADGGGQGDRVERHELADPQRAQPGAGDLERDPDRFLVRPVEPERQRRFDPPAHSIEASAWSPSRMRPGSSRDASLTWK